MACPVVYIPMAFGVGLTTGFRRRSDLWGGIAQGGGAPQERERESRALLRFFIVVPLPTLTLMVSFCFE